MSEIKKAGENLHFDICLLKESITLKHSTVGHKYLPRPIFFLGITAARWPGADASLPKKVDEIEAPLFCWYPSGVYLSQQWSSNMTCSLSPHRHECLYFSQHICYCLILEKKVAEQRIMKSKPNTQHKARSPW